MEQSGTSTRLQAAVQDLASGVVSALRGGGHAHVVPPVGTDGEAGDLALAAVRVLGADALLPGLLSRTPPDPAELAVFRKAVEAYPPRGDASPTVRWSHWAMARTLRRADPRPRNRLTSRTPRGWTARAGRSSPINSPSWRPSHCPARTAP